MRNRVGTAAGILLAVALGSAALVWLTRQGNATDESPRLAAPRLDALALNAIESASAHAREAQGLEAASQRDPAAVEDGDPAGAARVEPDDQGTAEWVDEEWRELRRSGVDQLAKPCEGRGLSRLLFRSHTFNPEDVYIPKAARDQLSAIFDPRIDETKAIHLRIVSASYNEMSDKVGPNTKATWKLAGTSRPDPAEIAERLREAIASRVPGNPMPTSQAVELSMLQKALWSKGFYCAWHGQELYAVPQSELEDSAALRNSLRQQLATLASLSLEWFSSAGTLSAERLSALEAQIAETFSSGG